MTTANAGIRSTSVSHFSTSANRHAVIPGPNLIGLGKDPALTLRQRVDAEIGSCSARSCFCLMKRGEAAWISLGIAETP